MNDRITRPAVLAAVLSVVYVSLSGCLGGGSVGEQQSEL